MTTILADHGIHTAGWIALGGWVVGGFLLGLVAAVWVHRSNADGGDSFDGEEHPGLTMLGVWVIAPLVAAGGLIAGLVWCLNRLAAGTDAVVQRKRPSRDRLERRIAELERELDL